jgi:hypothetical protein
VTEHHVSLDALSKIKDGTGHSIFGASGSHMFLACVGSLIPNILAPDESGPDAAYGTVAHGVTETWLDTGKRPDHLVGKKVVVGSDIETCHLVTIDEEMLHYAEQCVDRCEWEPGEQVIELHVDFSHLTPIPNQGGTLDFAALLRRRATVADHKFGASPNNIVYAEENPQLMLYAIGLWRDPRFTHYDFRDIIIRILQPRLNHFDEWHTTTTRLAEFEDYARERMAAAWKLNAPRTPGPKQCRFCKVRGSCAANAKLQEDLISGVFGDESVQTAEQMQEFASRLDDDLEPFRLHVSTVGNLSTPQMAKLLPYRSAAEAWWASLERELEKRGQHGEDIPGHKFVEGRTRRVFPSENKAINRLTGLGLPRKELITEKVVSPAQAEKLLRKHGYKTAQLPELLSDLVYKPAGRATLVPLSDRRPAVEDLSAIAFATDETPETEEDY